MSVIITLPGLDPLVYLIGGSGARLIDTRRGFWVLDGSFRLKIGELETNEKPFEGIEVGNPVQIINVPATRDRGTIRVIRGRDFSLNRSHLSGNKDGAWLRWQRIFLRKFASDFPLQLFFQDATLSLGVAESDAHGGAKIYYRADGHRIKKLDWKHNAGFSDGPFLQKTERGFEAIGGGASGDLVLDEPHTACLRIPENIQISFLMFKPDLSVPAANDPLVKIKAVPQTPPRRIELEVDAAANLKLPEIGGATSSKLTFDEIEIRGDWIISTVYRNENPPVESELILQRLPIPAGKPGTRLWTTSRRLSLWFRLNASTDNSVQLVHRDPAVNTPVSVTSAREKNRGLWIHGLGSSRSLNARLDASLATVTLSRTTNQFEFFAGGDIEVGGQTERSYLVPKPWAEFHSRVIFIPIADASLGCRWNPGQATPFIFETVHEGHLRAPGVRLLVPSLGAMAGQADGSPYGYLQLAPPGDFAFRLDNSGAFPEHGASWPTEFHQEPDAQELQVLSHPGTSLKFLKRNNRSTAFESRLLDGRETLAYSRILVSIKYRQRPAAAQPGDQIISDDNIKFFEEELNSVPGSADLPWTKRNQANDLVVVYSGDPGKAKIQQFTGNNSSGEPQRVLWPLGAGMFILLMDNAGGRKRFAPEIAISRGRTKTSLGFDFSSPDPTNPHGPHSGGIIPEYVGEPAGQDWKTLMQNESPVLWPRLLRPAGMSPSSRLDPTDVFWSGIFFRDMPLVFIRPTELQGEQKLLFLEALLEAIEEKLCLDYGWKDETGSTWKAEASVNKELTPEQWKNLFTMSVHGFRTQGANNRVVMASVNLSGSLPFIKDSAGRVFEFSGTGHFNLLEGAKLDKLEISPEKAFDSLSFPGFKRIKLHRLATDLQKVELDLSLYPGAELSKIFPFLVNEIPIRTTGEMELKGDTNSLTLGLVLPTDQPTNLYGKFPTTIQGATIHFDSQGEATLTFYCRLNLGLGGFKSVGARVILTKNTVNEPQIEVDRIQGNIDVAGFGANLTQVNWTPPPPPNLSAKKIDQIQVEPEFTGTLDLLQEQGLLRGVPNLTYRIGTTGELTYWIAASDPTTMKFGALSLEDLIVIIARHADYIGKDDHDENKDNLSRASEAVSTEPIKDLRTGKSTAEFLTRWRPSGKVGTFVAASGFLGGLSPIISSPKNRSLSGSENNREATALAFTDGGLMRVDASCNIMDTITVRFSVTIDWPKRYFRASFGMPRPLDFPSPAAPDLSVQVGQVVLGICFEERMFEVSLGWPEQLGGTALERDWSKSLMVFLSNFFPINTLWGGFRSSFGREGIVLGWAARGGWTRQYEFGNSLVGVRAELGVAVGGVMEFTYSPKDASRPILYQQTNPEAVLLRESMLPAKIEAELMDAKSIRQLDEFITERLQLPKIPIGFNREWYADVWGAASAQLFGVTVAGVELKAKARMRFTVSFDPVKICKIDAEASFTFTVHIGCVEKEASASLHIVVLDGHCPNTSDFRNGDNSYLLPA